MKYYKVILSNTKHEIVLDDEDFRLLSQGLQTGSFVQLKKAIVNPSFIITILPISQQEALDGEARLEVQGHLDEQRGVFVLDGGDLPTRTQLSNEF